MSTERAGRWAAVAAAVAFGTAPVATAFQLRTFEPVPAAMWRAAVGAVLLASITALSTRRSSAVRPRLDRAALLRLLVLGSLGGPVFLFGLNVAVSEVGASISGLVTGMYAVFAAVIAPFILGERLERQVLFGLVLALGGTAMLASLDVRGVSMGGMAAGVFAAVGYGFYLVLGRRWIGAHGLRPERVALSAATTAAVVFFVVVAVSDPGVLWPDRSRIDSLVALAWLGAVLAGGQTLVMISARLIHSRRSAAYLLLNPFTAAVLGVVVLDERLTFPQMVGGVLVLVGLALGSGVDVGAMRRRAGRSREGQST